MFNIMPILAQAAEPQTAADIDIVPIDLIWEQIAALNWLQAIFAVSFGAVYLLYGWRIFKILAVIAFGLAGMRIGMWLGGLVGSQLWGGVAGVVILGAVSIPLMRWAVSILGAAAGGVLTSGLWYAFELPQTYIWAGAIIGIIAGGMISFIVFKASVMLFTSLGGGALVVIGMLALFNSYEAALAEPTNTVKNLVYDYNWFVPILLIAATILGIIVQNKMVKGSTKWEL